jgi:hypothetical protein
MVATLRATDPDTLGHLTYSLVSGDEGHFQLDMADTGVLRLREALDREARDTYRLQVRASDGVQHTDTTVTIKVCHRCYAQYILTEVLNYFINSLDGRPHTLILLVFVRMNMEGVLDMRSLI